MIWTENNLCWMTIIFPYAESLLSQFSLASWNQYVLSLQKYNLDGISMSWSFNVDKYALILLHYFG